MRNKLGKASARAITRRIIKLPRLIPTDWKAPLHYVLGRKYEPLDVIEDWDLGYHLGNVVKYVARAGRKPATGELYDLHKASEYLRRKIVLLEHAPTPPRPKAKRKSKRDVRHAAKRGVMR